MHLTITRAAENACSGGGGPFAALIVRGGIVIAEGTNMWTTGRSKDPKLAYFAKNLDYYLGVMRAMLDGGGF